MFHKANPQGTAGSAATVVELIYHNTVRSVRRSHADAVMAILTNILQTVIFVMAFYFLFTVLGMRGNAIRGDFLLYIMTGIYLYLVHTKTVTAVMAAEAPSSAMMKHAPMTTAVALTSTALGTLYIQIMSMMVVTYVYHVGWGPITILYWPGALGMILLAWATGFGVGLILYALKPWAPGLTGTVAMVYTRANMIASGKMFVANQLPGYMVAWFSWNPLFHAIDQARGFTFVNYFPHVTSAAYPLYVCAGLFMIGLMAEHYTRRNASLSWDARR